MKIDVFVFAHTVDIIRRCEASQKFYRTFPEFRYVLLGQHRDVTGLPSNCIVAADLPDNLEQYNRCVCAYTGWHAVSKNIPLTGTHILLLEYDVVLSEDFLSKLEAGIQDNEFISFKKLNSVLFFWIMGFEKLSEEERKASNLKGLFYWMVTTNVLMRMDTFYEFVNWFTAIVHESQKDNPNASHIVERSITRFARKYNRKYGFVLNVLHHYQLDSHGTQNLKGRFEKNIEKVTS